MRRPLPEKKRRAPLASADRIGRALLSISVTSILFVGVGAFLLSYYSLHQQTGRHLQTLISFAASESRSAIEFQDTKTASDILESIPEEEGIVLAEIRDVSDNVLARIDRRRKGLTGVLAALIGNELVTQDVIVEKQRIGRVILEGGSEPMLNALGVLFAWFVFGMLVFATGATAVGHRLTMRFTLPILQLREVVKRLVDDRDFNRRAPPSSLAEVEDLRTEFNVLLDEIRLRDHLLTQSNEALRRVAYLDALTGLPNRAMFDAALRKSISECDQQNKRACLFYLDIDAFKSINDTFGHDVGDHLLSTVAARLRVWKPEETLSARLGGDVFVILLSPLPDNTDLDFLLRHLRRDLEQPVKHGDVLIQPRISIGAAVYPDHAPSAEEFVRRADQMMYVAKNRHYQSSRITHWKSPPAISDADPSPPSNTPSCLPNP